MNATMQRYQFDSSQPWMKRLVDAATAYYQRYGVPPVLAVIHLSHRDAPTEIGLMRVIRDWGPQKNEVDMGPIPADQAATVEKVPPVEQVSVVGNDGIQLPLMEQA